MIRYFTLMVVLCVSVAPNLAHADAGEDFDRSHLRATRFDLHAMEVLTAGGALSTAVGVGLLTTDRYDEGLRIAGGITAGFGVVNLALGALGIWQAKRAERAYLASAGARSTPQGLADAQRADLRKAQKDTVLFGINLGLDVGYVLAGSAAIIASQLGADHSSRWLAGGVATCVQGAFNVAIDLALVLNSNRHHRGVIDSLVPMVAVVPTPEGTRADFEVSGRF